MNDDELDHLFRDAAEEYSKQSGDKNASSTKAALWERLEAKLDNPAYPDRSRRRRWGYLIVLLLVGIGTLIWVINPLGKRSEQTKEIASIESVKPGNNENFKTPETTGKGQSDVAEAVKTKRSKPVQNEKRKSELYGHGFISKKPAAKSIPSVSTNPSTKYEARDGLPDEDQNFNQAQLALLKKELKMTQGVKAEFQGIDAVIIPDQIASYDDNTHVGGLQEVAAILSERQAQPGAEKHDDQKDSKVSTLKHVTTITHWQFGLTVGPDWSSVAGKGWRTGVGGGLKLSYRLNPKWAFSTGVLLDKKLYDARPSDYNPPDNNWRNYDVKSIDASCIVIDVPLNVEYTLWHQSANRLFIAGGMSSFWMREEEYTYHYKTASGGWDQWSKEMYNKNRHLLSIINFSPGYEHSWQHLSIQVAPYLKIPASGIGYGKVKLYSTGIHFTLQYGLK